MNDYDKLKKISIDDCFLINKQVNIDPVYAFCKKNNIKTVGDLIICYKNKLASSEITKKYNLYYFEGIIDLICFYYLGYDIKNNKVLDMFTYFSNYINSRSYYGYVIKGDKNSLRKLGLTNNESKALLNYVARVKEKVRVIDVIKNYLDDNKKISLSKEEQFVFLNKLKLLCNYYKSNDLNEEEIESYKLHKINELFDKYEMLKKDKLKIEKEMLVILSDILKLKNSLSTQEKKVYSKKYSI